jgi:hypothetical protein
MAEDPTLEGLGLVGIRDIFGAAEALSVQLLAVYLPDRDKDGSRIDHDAWVEEALEIFSNVGGGASAVRGILGAWLNPGTGNLIREETTLIYTFVLPEKFVHYIPELRTLFHEFGLSTNQGEVMFYFGGVAYRITEFSVEG